MLQPHTYFLFFFFNDTATTEIYTLSLHDALPISQHDGEERHGQVRADHEHTAAVTHQRGLFDLRADHHSWGITQEQERNIKGVTQLHEPGGFVCPITVNGAREVHRVVGDDAQRTPLNPYERSHHARTEV